MIKKIDYNISPSKSIFVISGVKKLRIMEMHYKDFVKRYQRKKTPTNFSSYHEAQAFIDAELEKIKIGEMTPSKGYSETERGDILSAQYREDLLAYAKDNKSSSKEIRYYKPTLEVMQAKYDDSINYLHSKKKAYEKQMCLVTARCSELRIKISDVKNSGDKKLIELLFWANNLKTYIPSAIDHVIYDYANLIAYKKDSEGR